VTFTRHFAHWPPGVPHTLDLPRESVYTNLAARAAEHPDRIAVDYYGTHVTYAELKREADALAGFLQQRCGVAKGDRVLLYLQNCPQFIIAYYAILRVDAVVVPVNPMNRTEELRHYVEDAQARVALVGQELYDRISPLEVAHVIVATYSDFLRTPSDLPVPDFVRAPRMVTAGIAWRDAIAAALTPGEHRAGADDLAVMPYTWARPASRKAACTRTRACSRRRCRISTGAARPRTRWCSRRCPCSTSPACRPG
jgi:fatty-acyl-CoA synthase